MKEILKFQHDLLEGEDIHIRRKVRDTSYQSHWHSYYEIILYMNCRGKCILNGSEYEISGNCLYFLTPQDFHRIETIPDRESSSVIISFSEKLLNASQLRLFSGGARIINDVNIYTIQRINELYVKFQEKKPYFKDYLKYLLGCVLLDIAAEAMETSTHGENLSSPIRNAIAVLHQNPSAQIKLNDVAKAVSLTPSYFSHLFHSEIGCNFKTYLNNLKISYAKRLLEETDLSVLEVSMECGFGSVSQFHRVFKEHTGVTPSKYKFQ